jgi:hypothetical protein
MKEFEVSDCPADLQETPCGTRQAILRVLPFTPTSVNGKTYWITQADISMETSLGNQSKEIGFIFDREMGREYALAIDDFHQFMETGDLSLLPKQSTCSPKVKTLQLRELWSNGAVE